MDLSLPLYFSGPGPKVEEIKFSESILLERPIDADVARTFSDETAELNFGSSP